jgi:hypothetical protein
VGGVRGVEGGNKQVTQNTLALSPHEWQPSRLPCTLLPFLLSSQAKHPHQPFNVTATSVRKATGAPPSRWLTAASSRRRWGPIV